MRILIAPDKFKGSLTGGEVAAAIEAGLRAGWPDDAGELVCVSCPIADGGDGLAETLVKALGGTWRELVVNDPLGERIPARYGWIEDSGGGALAIIEMAAASGLALLAGRSLDPARASTFGTGELLRHAVDSGAKEILLGIGGSGTNDGGSGVALAMGFRFFDAEGRARMDLPKALRDIVRIVPPTGLRLPSVTVACDVTNPLLGPDGCTRIYGPQKGIRSEEIPLHEERLAHLVELLGTPGETAARLAGAGAAGGLGFGAMVFLDAVLAPGFELVADYLGLGSLIAGADLVISGEGRLDAQSLCGKGPHGVVQMARRAGKATAMICGSYDGESLIDDFGPIWAIRRPDRPLDEDLAEATSLIQIQAAAAAPSLARLSRA